MPPSLAPASAWSSVDNLKASILWTQALATMLLARTHHQVDTERLAAFAKRLSAVAMRCETGEAVGALAVVRELLCRHVRLRRLLENEHGSASAYLPDVAEPAASCALSSCLWELASLSAHFHPAVATMARHIAEMPVEEAPPPAPFGQASPVELVTCYSTMNGCFRPAVASVAARVKTQRGRAKSAPPVELEGTWKEETSQAAKEFFRSSREFEKHAHLFRETRRLRKLLRAYHNSTARGGG